MLVRTLYMSLIVVSAQVLAEPKSNDDVRINDAEFETLIKRMSPPGNTPSEVRALDAAHQSQNFQKSRAQFDAIIAKPITQFLNPYYGSHLKATAYAYRSELPWASESEKRLRALDKKASIAYGHLPTVSDFSLAYLQHEPSAHLFAAELSEEELTKIFRTGAELGDSFSAGALGFANLSPSISADEKSYWALMTIMRDRGKSREDKEVILNELLSRLGDAHVEDILAKYSISGSILPSSELGLPKRGIRSTLFVDGDLRGTLGLGHGHKTEPQKHVPDPPTVREQFNFYSKIVPEVGYGDVYMLVPNLSIPMGKRVISSQANRILNELGPGDRVFVSCGPLSHVAILFKRDREKKQLLFIDPLYEFWQPSHNSCVKSSKFVEYKHKRFLTTISEEDVKEMLQAVIVIRDAAPH